MYLKSAVGKEHKVRNKACPGGNIYKTNQKI